MSHSPRPHPTAPPRCARADRRGLTLALAVAVAIGCEGGPGGGPEPADCDALVSGGRSAASELGAPEREIGSIRVTVETGRRNGAGTDNAILVWFDNRRARISPPAERALAPGESESIVLSGDVIPQTLGALTNASILLTLDLGRAEIAASWYCAQALVEVRFAGSEEYVRYLEASEIGWLSQDEPPRRSTAYALQ